jgi:hypothetical protein
MGPAAGVYDVDSADPAIIRGIGVGLQYSCEFIQEVGRAIAPAAHAKIEHRRSARSSLLPQIGLVICSAAIVGLHIHGCFVGLDVASRQ